MEVVIWPRAHPGRKDWVGLVWRDVVLHGLLEFQKRVGTGIWKMVLSRRNFSISIGMALFSFSGPHDLCSKA